MRTYLPDFFTPYPVHSFFDDFDRAFFDRKPASKQEKEYMRADLMKTDIKELDDKYELSVELPGYKKEEVELTLDKGYLTIAGKKEENNEDKDENGKIIRQERFSGSMHRSFFVGEDVKHEDIGAKFEDGILKICVPKKEKKEEIPEVKTIAIE